MGDNNHGKNYVDISSDNNRDTFDSKLGFILACIGSAVGMGNIWMFPYRVGQLGGAAFLVPYFIFIIVIGFTGVIGEMSFGRAMEQVHWEPLKRHWREEERNMEILLGLSQ